MMVIGRMSPATKTVVVLFLGVLKRIDSIIARFYLKGFQICQCLHTCLLLFAYRILVETAFQPNVRHLNSPGYQDQMREQAFTHEVHERPIPGDFRRKGER